MHAWGRECWEGGCCPGGRAVRGLLCPLLARSLEQTMEGEILPRGALGGKASSAWVGERPRWELACAAKQSLHTLGALHDATSGATHFSLFTL
eukprot:315534-Chlamydomonas_euryale.AAC.5